MTIHPTIQATAPQRSTLRSSLRQLIARHPVSAFLILAFTFAWATIVPLLLAQQGFGVLPISLPVKPFNALASYVGLALPAFLVTAAIGGRAGVNDLLRRSLRWRVGLQWYLFALFGLLVAVLMAAIPFVGLAPLSMLGQQWALLFTVFLPGVLGTFLLFNWAEEIAWTGFLQAHWQTRRGPVWASLLVAPLFALIHLPAYFVAGWISDERIPLDQYPTLLVQLGITIIFSLFFRLLIMWLYNGTGRSLLLVGLFHSAFNLLTGQQIIPLLLLGPSALWLNLLVIAVATVVAVLVTLLTKGRLGYKQPATEGRR